MDECQRDCLALYLPGDGMRRCLDRCDSRTGLMVIAVAGVIGVIVGIAVGIALT